MRKINDFKNNALKVERVPKIFENLNSFETMLKWQKYIKNIFFGFSLFFSIFGFFWKFIKTLVKNWVATIIFIFSNILESLSFLLRYLLIFHQNIQNYLLYIFWYMLAWLNILSSASQMMLETINTTNNFLTKLALHSFWILVNIYTILPSHVKSIATCSFFRCHVSYNSRIICFLHFNHLFKNYKYACWI